MGRHGCRGKDRDLSEKHVTLFFFSFFFYNVLKPVVERVIVFFSLAGCRQWWFEIKYERLWNFGEMGSLSHQSSQALDRLLTWTNMPKVRKKKRGSVDCLDTLFSHYLIKLWCTRSVVNVTVSFWFKIEMWWRPSILALQRPSEWFCDQENAGFRTPRGSGSWHNCDQTDPLLKSEILKSRTHGN